MNALHPSSLDSAALACRLGELVGDERNVQVDFLLHLDEFDRRRGYLEAGFGSLWEYCLRCLHLREGASGRRIGAMRVLRRFPKLEGALRDGRLCLSTASLLGQVLTDDNLDELVSRAAYRTKAEVEHLVASVRPRTAPKEGIRKLPAVVLAPSVTPTPRDESAESGPPPLLLVSTPATPPAESAAPPPLETPEPPAEPAPARRHPAEVRPVSKDEWSVRVTLDTAGKEELETLKALLSHKIPDGNLAEVLREAIHCGIEKHGKRKGATPPATERQRQARGARSDRHIPAAVRREVWTRDGGTCSWKSEDGRRCGSRWRLEIDHIRSADARRLVGPREPPPALPSSQHPSRGARLRPRAHGAVQAGGVHYRWRW